MSVSTVLDGNTSTLKKD